MGTGSKQPTANVPSELEAITERAEQAEARADREAVKAKRAEMELAYVKRPWLYRMCPACFRAPKN